MIMKFGLSWLEGEGAATGSCTMSHHCEFIKKKIERREKIIFYLLYFNKTLKNKSRHYFFCNNILKPLKF